MKASVLDLRCHMGKVLKALDRNENVTLTYRGHEKATIVPKKISGGIDIKNHLAFGLWKNRADMKDVDAAVRGIRKGRMNAF
jgi:hypothetical protein